MIKYNNKNFQKNWFGLNLWLQEKAWCLAKETEQFRKESRNDLFKKQYWLLKAEHQEPKIIFICGLLSEFFDDFDTGEKIFKFKNWQFSKDGNFVLTQNEKTIDKEI